MTTLTDFMMKQQNMLRRIRLSAERRMKSVENLFRHNQQLAKMYDDTIRPELALRGWFIAGSLNHNQFQQLSQAFKEGRESDIEEFLKDHTNKRIPDITSSTLQRWPSREHILSDAFDAHTEQKYTLSVPVLLSQADGISHDLLGAFLFTNRKGKISDKASQLRDDKFSNRPLAKSFLGLLLEASGLSTDTCERDKQIAERHVVSSLNRHGVLHGLDCDYATEANSLRGISLIEFLEWVAEVIEHKQNEDTPDKNLDADIR